MGIKERLLMQMFGHPKGLLGYLGGKLMEGKGPVYRWVLALLEVQPADRILEVGFGPGVGIQCAAAAVPQGSVAGVDYSDVMVSLARKRNAGAIREGRVELLQGSATHLPFGDGSFTKALSVNSLQLWPDPIQGLSEMRRALQPGGTIAITFTPASGQSGEGLIDQLCAAGFAEVRAERSKLGVTAVGRRPR